MNKLRLRIPGPTEVPEQVLMAMQKPMIGHRGKEFEEIFAYVSEAIKKVFQTNNDVLIFPASGTGAMEAAISNLFSPGDKLLSFPNGVFSERFAKIAEKFGAIVERTPVEWGLPVNPEIVKGKIKEDKNHMVKGVLLTHNETSTGVLNDIKAIREAMGDHPALVVVDAVSSLGGVDLKTDEWNLDVVVTGAQKALMLPPGLGFISVSPRALKQAEKSKMPKFYWDFRAAKKSLLKNQNPYTPAVSLIFALKESLDLINKEGLENVFKRHLILSRALREGIKALGLKLFAKESHASPTVTSVNIEGVSIEIKKLLESDFNMMIAGGQQSLKGKILRIGHMGYVDKLDIISVLAAIEMTLDKENLYGKGVRAAQIIFKEREGLC